MHALKESWNDTMSLNQINMIMPLISLMSSHFLVNSFTLVTDMEVTSAKTFVKISSQFYFEMNCEKSVDNVHVKPKNELGYIALEKLDLDFSQMFKNRPKLVVAMYTVREKDPVIPKLLSEVVIPATTAFFVIPLSDTSKNFYSNKTVKCLRLYKPVSNFTLKVFPIMFYEGQEESKWTWESKNMNWYTFQKEVTNMKGINISIAMASRLSKNLAASNFWAGRYSFFWKILEHHLGFRTVIIYQQSLNATKSTADILRKLLRTVADSLSFLPALTSERGKRMSFVVTGIDQKYYLLVRAPQYVHSWQSVIKPLALESWICLAIFILLISITLRITTCGEKSSTTDLSSCCLIIFGYVCSQGCPNAPRNVSSCVVCYTALLFSIIIYQFYTSNFYSLLSTKEVSLPFTSLDDFVAKRTHALYIHPDTAIYTDIVNATNGTLKAVWDIIKNDPSHQLKTHTMVKSYENVCRGSAAVLGLPYQTIHNIYLMCKLVPVNSGFFPTNTVTALRKGFPFLSQFKFVHLRLKESGVTQKFRHEYFHVEQQSKTEVDVVNEPVTLVHVGFLFALHVSSLALSLLILSLEIVVSKTKKRKKIKTNKFP